MVCTTPINLLALLEYSVAQSIPFQAQHHNFFVRSTRYFFDSVDLECTFDIKLVENSVVRDLKVDCCERGRQTIWKTKHLDELVLILLNKHDDVPFME